MSNRLQLAYDRAKRWLRADLPEAESAAAQSLSKMMARAKEYLVAAEELSVEEAQKVVDVLHFDLREWGQDLRETRAELADWARFDIDQFEHAVAERLLAAADPTWVELERFEHGRKGLGEDV